MGCPTLPALLVSAAYREDLFFRSRGSYRAALGRQTLPSLRDAAGAPVIIDTIGGVFSMKNADGMHTINAKTGRNASNRHQPITPPTVIMSPNGRCAPSRT